MKSKWNGLMIAGKVLYIARLVGATGAIIFALLQMFEIWEKAIHVSTPLMGVVLLLQATQEWKKQRGMAILGLCAALFIFVCAIVVWFF